MYPLLAVSLSSESIIITQDDAQVLVHVLYAHQVSLKHTAVATLSQRCYNIICILL